MYGVNRRRIPPSSAPANEVKLKKILIGEREANDGWLAGLDTAVPAAIVGDVDVLGVLPAGEFLVAEKEGKASDLNRMLGMPAGVCGPDESPAFVKFHFISHLRLGNGSQVPPLG